MLSIYFSSIYVIYVFPLVSFLTLLSFYKARYNNEISKQLKLDKIVLYLAYLSILLIAYTNAYFYTEYHRKNHFSKIQNIEKAKIKLTTTPIEKEKSFKAEAKIEEVIIDNKIKQYKGKIICYFKKDSSIKQLKTGDLLFINSKLNEIDIARNPNEFSYKQYLSYKNISHQVYLTTNSWTLIKSNKNIINLILFKTKRKLQQIINENIYNKDERAVASALLLGNRNLLSDEILQSFSSTGATHILAVSGLHVGIFYGIISFSFLWLKRFKKLKILHPIIIIASIWFYVALTGGSPSVVRAATMFSFIAIGFALNRYINIYNIIAFSALLISLFNPYIITDVGFQLSYFAVTGIIFLYDKVYGLIYIPNFLLDKIWSITSVSIAAQISTFPLIILYFHQFPNLFFISNLIVIPAASIILYGGILMFLLSWNEHLLYYTSTALSEFIKILNKSLGIIEQIPYALSTKLYISYFQAFMFYLCIALFVIAFSKREKLSLKYGLFSSLVLMLSFSYNYYLKATQKELIVYHVPPYSAIEIIDGHKAHSIFDSTLLNNENLLNFRVEHNWWQKQIHTQNYNFDAVLSAEISSNKIYSFNKKKIAIIDEQFIYPQQTINIDYAIIKRNSKLNLMEFSSKIKAELYVFDSSNKKYKTKYWKQDCESLGINCYFVSDSTAFQTKL